MKSQIFLMPNFSSLVSLFDYSLIQCLTDFLTSCWRQSKLTERSQFEVYFDFYCFGLFEVDYFATEFSSQLNSGYSLRFLKVPQTFADPCLSQIKFVLSQALRHFIIGLYFAFCTADKNLLESTALDPTCFGKILPAFHNV